LLYSLFPQVATLVLLLPLCGEVFEFGRRVCPAYFFPTTLSRVLLEANFIVISLLQCPFPPPILEIIPSSPFFIPQHSTQKRVFSLGFGTYCFPKPLFSVPRPKEIPFLERPLPSILPRFFTVIPKLPLKFHRLRAVFLSFLGRTRPFDIFHFFARSSSLIFIPGFPCSTSLFCSRGTLPCLRLFSWVIV